MKRFRVIYDGGHFIGSLDCDSYEEAISTAESIYFEWLCGEAEYLSIDMNNFGNLSKDQIDNWNEMIYDCEVFVTEIDAADNEIGRWYVDDEWLTSIGWSELPR